MVTRPWDQSMSRRLMTVVTKMIWVRSHPKLLLSTGLQHNKP